MAILIAVFAPLEFFVQGTRLTAALFGLTLVPAALLFVVGLLLEVKYS
jgi:hypothetical protein